MPPSPRFHRLPEERREHILAVARRHIAEEGPEGMSVNRVIADAGISRTSAYMYFDGKDDLVAEVYRDFTERILAVAGEWEDVETADAFWAQLRASSERMRAHHAENPEDLALLGHWPDDLPMPNPDGWLEAILDNGRALGEVRRDVPEELMSAATQAVLQACDSWAIAMMLDGRGSQEDLEPVWILLRGLWKGDAPGDGCSDGRARGKKKKRKQKKGEA